MCFLVINYVCNGIMMKVSLIVKPFNMYYIHIFCLYKTRVDTNNRTHLLDDNCKEYSIQNTIIFTHKNIL